MEAMRQSWTDERLDDGFDRVDADLRAIRTEIGTFRVETNDRFDKVEKRVDDRFDRWQRLLFQVGGGMLIGLIGLLATLMGVILTRL
jgi:hypothetical protein